MTKKKVVKVGAVKTPKAPKLDFHLEVSVNDLVYKGDAISLEQALTDFVNSPVFPFAIKSRVLVKFSNGDTELQQTWPVVKARRMFNLMSLKESSIELLAGQLTSNLANA